MESLTSTLGLNWPGFIWHAVNFGVLLFLLQRVLYKPITRMLDERARRIRDSMEAADHARRQAQQAEADRQALLSETRREAEQIRARADEQAKRILADAEARAQERAQHILDQAEANSRQLEERIMAGVRAQLADLVVTAVDRVTRSAIDQKTQRSLVQQFLTTDGGTGDGSVQVAPRR
jgi:F-type H+-transporting ATPase subunit b